MDLRNPNIQFGLGFLLLGIALMIVTDPWFLGVAFLIIGGQRIFVELKDGEQSES